MGDKKENEQAPNYEQFQDQLLALTLCKPKTKSKKTDRVKLLSKMHKNTIALVDHAASDQARLISNSFPSHLTGLKDTPIEINKKNS